MAFQFDTFTQARVESRADQEKAAAAVSQFLDTYWYPHEAAKYPNVCYERVTDKERQVKGIDCMFTYCDSGDPLRRIDEKAKVCAGYLNRLADPISFELLRLNRRGEWQLGWLLAPGQDTEAYAFISVFTSPGFSLADYGAAAIEKAVVLLVRKDDVFCATAAVGYDMGGLCMAAADMSRHAPFPGSDGKSRLHLSDDFWLTFSPCYKERPVNLVASRDTLKVLPHTCEWSVRPDGYDTTWLAGHAA